MDKFLTFEGQQPIYLGDIDFMQESVRKAISCILQVLTGSINPTFILQAPTPESDGVVCIEGEILPFKYTEPQIGMLEQPIGVLTETLGNRRLKNGTTIDCHQYRYAMRVSGGAYNNVQTWEQWSVNKVLYNKITFNDHDGNRSVYVSFAPMASNSLLLDVQIVGKASSYTISQYQSSFPAFDADARNFTGDYYTYMCLDNAGTLSLMPVKVAILQNSPGSIVEFTCTFPQTTFTAEMKGTISLTIIK